MKTRIRCTETIVDGVKTQTYLAEVFCWWFGMTTYLWPPAEDMLLDIDRGYYWANAEQALVLLKGTKAGTKERAMAVIDLLHERYNHILSSRLEKKTRKREAKRTKRTTFEDYPED